MAIDKNTLEPNINVNGVKFAWNLEKGEFLFEEEDAVLFWISSAMKNFFDTIEEVTGSEAYNVVLETTGFRQGMVVGDFFKKLNMPISEVVNSLSTIYGTAGWGHFSLVEIDLDQKKATLRSKDSWEYKINKEQGKETTGTFLVGHFSGLLTALFGTNMGYRMIEDQLTNNEYSEFEFFPSDRTVENNIHALARREQALQIQKLEEAVEHRTRELNELVKEISSPVIPVLDGIVVVPLLGRYDEARSEDLVEKTLKSLPRYKTDYLVLDLTGLSKDICEFTVEFLNKLASAAALIGIETILVGISPELGKTIVQTDFQLGKFNCFTNLQHGIYYALAQQGRKLY